MLETALREKMVSGQVAPQDSSTSGASTGGVALRTFVSEKCGATGFSTGTATFPPQGKLVYHTHPCSEAITVLRGNAQVSVEGRAYLLRALDSMHIPAGVVHSTSNPGVEGETVVHWAFGSAEPRRDLVQCDARIDDLGYANPAPNHPETIRRFAEAEKYELSEGAIFVDLFARRFGAKGICGGYGQFAPGASLPCHIHDYDESITIVEGRALCMVQGARYELSGFGTAFVPTGRPHRFLNQSDAPMAMLWVYAGDEPDRRLMNPGYCDGSLRWPGAAQAIE